MEQIEKIIQLRKDYAYKLYDFYSRIIEQLPAVSSENIISINQIILEEKNYWDKWQNRVEKLNRFNSEIDSLNQKNAEPKLTQNKLLEIVYLRSSFEKEADDSKKHYQIILSKVKQTRTSVMDDLSSQLLSLSTKDRQLSYLHKHIHDTHSTLQMYCDNWKSKHIDNLQKITMYIYEIETLCQSISEELDNFDQNAIEDEEEQYFDKLKSLFFADQCTKLSQLIEDLLNNYNIFELLNKLKSEESLNFKQDFSKIFHSKHLGSIRNNIRIINNVSSTRKKINIVYQSFKKLHTILNPEIEKLQQKKQKLLSLCTTASDLSKITTEKWIVAHYQQIFKKIDELLLQRQKLLESLSS